jgi:hypothetical protein
VNQYIHPATEDDVRFIAANMRQADIEEAGALGLSPLDALMLSHHHAIKSYTLISPDGEPIAITGVSPSSMGDVWGAIWLLGTGGIEKFPKTFLRNSIPVLDLLYEETGRTVFHNFAYAENDLHLKWLRWLGFKFIRTVNLPPHDKDFVEFVRLRT